MKDDGKPYDHEWNPFEDGGAGGKQCLHCAIMEAILDGAEGGPAKALEKLTEAVGDTIGMLTYQGGDMDDISQRFSEGLRHRLEEIKAAWRGEPTLLNMLKMERH